MPPKTDPGRSQPYWYDPDLLKGLEEHEKEILRDRPLVKARDDFIAQQLHNSPEYIEKLRAWEEAMDAAAEERRRDIENRIASF